MEMSGPGGRQSESRGGGRLDGSSAASRPLCPLSPRLLDSSPCLSTRNTQRWRHLLWQGMTAGQAASAVSELASQRPPAAPSTILLHLPHPVVSPPFSLLTLSRCLVHLAAAASMPMARATSRCCAASKAAAAAVPRSMDSSAAPDEESDASDTSPRSATSVEAG